MVQARIPECSAQTREGSSQILIAMQQRGLLTAIKVQQAEVMAHCLKAFEFFLCLLCLQSLHFSWSVSGFATLLLSIFHTGPAQ